MKRVPADYEPLLNARLADLLRSGENIALSKAEPTETGETGRVDVRLETTTGNLIVLEAKKGETHNLVGIQAAGRLDVEKSDLVPDAAIAVIYPDDLQADHLTDDTTIEWAILFTYDQEIEYTSDSVASLRNVLIKIEAGVGDPDIQVQRINAALDAGVRSLTDQQKEEIAEALDLPTKEKGKSRLDAAAKRGLLVIATAAMFHARLDGTLANLKIETDARTGKPFTGSWPPPRLHDCRENDDVVEALYQAWQLILAYDYRPIFEAACKALHAPSQQNLAWTKAVAACAAAAQNAARSAAALRHDLIGRIFHRLLDSARYDGSFYTSAAAAALLAGLAIRPSDVPDNLADWKVIDPACGTGTLLMAAAERARDIRHQKDDTTTGQDSTTLIEHALCGLDVNLTACHMAATTLGLLSPSTAFKQMGVALMPLGMVEGEDGGTHARVGSLELLEADWRKGHVEQEMFGLPTDAATQIDSEELIRFNPNQHHLVIMNPPYTRGSLRHDQFDDATHDALKAREKELMKDRAGHGSSAGSMFMDLAEHLCRIEDGTFACVLPLTSANNPSGQKVRELLGQWFHLEYVVAPHDPRRFWFSENTNISEMLIVARRHPAPPRERPSTKFVCLRRNSDRPHDTAVQAEQILDGRLQEQIGVVSEWPAERIARGEWRPLAVFSAYLAATSERLTGEGFVELGEVAEVGPQGRSIGQGFTKHEVADEHGRQALWNNDTTRERTLATTPDVYAHVKPSKAAQRKADNYWNKRAHLLICTRPRLNTAHILAAFTKTRIVACAWETCRPKDSTINEEQWAKALTAYLNSTLGIIATLAVTSPHSLSRPQTSLDAMRKLLIPALTAEHITQLADAFDANANTPLRPLREADQCEVRKRLDEAVAAVTPFDEEELKTLRHELANEPSVQNTSATK